MTTALYWHPDCAAHDPGAGHPESPARLSAVLDALDTEEFKALDRREAPLAADAAITRVHDAAYVRAVLDAVPADGHRALDPDTVLSPASGSAALRAAGATVAAVDAVFAGEAANAFAAVRPPGHHAERDRAMGFCLFNNIAVGAAHARAQHGASRVAAIDFDVHHGNGTQAMFQADGDLFYASTHQYPAYPGSGAETERGLGNIVNVPLALGAGSVAFRAAYEEIILPALDDFAPDLVMVSAGFDAHARDPLCQLEVATEDFAWLSEALVAAAARYCDGRLVSTLEGGYDLDALSECVAAHVGALMTA
jgi:acetoin utilization deacetylase AcuC-like enzyme